MKKILFSLVMVMYLMVGIPVSAKSEPVQVYMLSKDGCSACIAAQDYFEGLESDYPGLFELKEIVVFDGEWEAVSSDRTDLLIKVYERFGENTKKASTPTIVIGDYHTIGLPNDTSEVYDAIVDARDNKSEDEVMKIIDELDLDLEELLKYESTTNTNNPADTPSENTGGKYDTIIIIGIFVVLIGGLASLVVVGKK